jgi:hypothetical protein
MFLCTQRNARASKISFQLEINSLSLFVNNNKTLGLILGSGEKGFLIDFWNFVRNAGRIVKRF